jgi:hypothetical protein
LKERQDTLEQQAEELAGSLEREAINPDKLRPIREIQYAIRQGALQVTNAQPGYRYSWVCTQMHAQGIWQKKTLGWETVHGDMPESREHTVEDSSRRIGDTILMRIPEERAREIDAYNEYMAQTRLVGTENELIDFGEAYRGRGLSVSRLEDMPENKQRAVAARGAAGRAGAKELFMEQATKSVALGAIDEKLREGNVPGLPKV